MSTTTPIAKRLDTPALDQRQLFELGLACIRRIAARTWTDHNIHDPGITILELAAYALTDLAYRASLPIEDLLTTETIRAHFHTARTILPGRPLTELDYRKRLIDVPQVKNAWLQPARASLHAGPLEGIYDILLEPEDDVDPTQTVADVRRVLDANRNLCEDFDHIRLVKTLPFKLCCELDILPSVDHDEVAAEVLFRVNEYMAPGVPRHSLAEMLALTRADGSRYTIDQIFEGPALGHGFITDEDLMRAELRTELRLSDIIQVIMRVDGVVAVRDVVVRPTDAAAEPLKSWVIPLPAHSRAMLDIEASGSRLAIYKRGVRVRQDVARIEVAVKQLGLNNGRNLGPEDLPLPSGARSAVDEYYSFQNHFPAIYGVSDVGLSSHASHVRRVQVDQLKAYLLFFDQIMADFLAKLGRVAELYSVDEDRAPRFHQVVDSFRDYARIYGVDAMHVNEAIQQRLDALDDEAEQVQKRERFLDHLIARVAEDLSELAAVRRSAFATVQADISRMKREFLRNYPTLSAERGLAWNRASREPEAASAAIGVSGFQRRLAALLGLGSSPAPEREMLLIENILLRPRRPDDPLLSMPSSADDEDVDPYSFRMHVLLPAGSVMFENMNFRRWVEETIREECPAHVLPKIVWLSQDDMARVASAHAAWMLDESGDTLRALFEALSSVRNVRNINPAVHQLPKFVLGRSVLVTSTSNER